MGLAISAVTEGVLVYHHLVFNKAAFRQKQSTGFSIRNFI